MSSIPEREFGRTPFYVIYLVCTYREHEQANDKKRYNHCLIKFMYIVEYDGGMYLFKYKIRLIALPFPSDNLNNILQRSKFLTRILTNQIFSERILFNLESIALKILCQLPILLDQIKHVNYFLKKQKKLKKE